MSTAGGKKRRTPVRRSKTYTGCWTCRKRGMKCDERPTSCLRCAESLIACEGYDFKLVWKNDPRDDTSSRRVQRRSMFDGSERYVTVLNESEIDNALDTLDEAHVCKTLGPFTVFSVASQSRRTLLMAGDTFISPVLSPSLSSPENEVWPWPHHRENTISHLMELDTYRIDRDADIKTWEVDLPRILVPFSRESSREERRLMHDWVTSMSEIMLPVGNGAQNPIVKVIYSMANSSPWSPKIAVSQSALRHGIFALGAFNRAEIFPETISYRNTAFQHYRLSLAYLRQSLAEEEESPKDLILSSILAIAAIGIIVGDSADWRIHLHGARNWVITQGSDFWNQNQETSLIYQLFLFVDGIGSLHPVRRRTISSQMGNEELHSEYLESSQDGQYEYYKLDALFGITEPLLKIITEINKMASLTMMASSSYIMALEERIYQNRPLPKMTEDISIPYSEALQQTYFYACLIHMKRALQKVSPAEVSHLIDSIVRLLQTAEQFEDDFGCCEPGDMPKVPYPVWPIFIAACEAEEPMQRDILLHRLKKGRLIGLGNMLSAASICEEVWKRRARDSNADIYWHDVMMDMKLDVLLL